MQFIKRLVHLRFISKYYILIFIIATNKNLKINNSNHIKYD